MPIAPNSNAKLPRATNLLQRYKVGRFLLSTVVDITQ